MVALLGNTDSAGSGCCELRNPRTIRTTAVYKLYLVYNQLGGRLAYPHVWVRNCLLVVFGIVSRILDISCDIFGIYRYQYREHVRDISIPISCDISHDINTIHVNTNTPNCGVFVFTCSIVSMSCDICQADYQKV